jgi:hypothetical protein
LTLLPAALGGTEFAAFSIRDFAAVDMVAPHKTW